MTLEAQIRRHEPGRIMWDEEHIGPMWLERTRLDGTVVFIRAEISYGKVIVIDVVDGGRG